MKWATLASVLVLAACSTSQRYPGWQHVRIEYGVPSEECVYKIQEACGKAGATCFNFYKQRATTFGANTVVITERDQTINSQSRGIAINGSGGSRSSTTEHMIALADYYHCPK